MDKLKKLYSAIKWAWSIFKLAWLYTVLLSTSIAIIWGGITLIFPTIFNEPLTMPLFILQVSFIGFVIIFVSSMIVLVIFRLIAERFSGWKGIVHKRVGEIKVLPPTIKIQINSKDFAKINPTQVRQIFDGITQSFIDYVRALKEWDKITDGGNVDATKESQANKGKISKAKGKKKGGKT
jgi:hypothetical protein